MFTEEAANNTWLYAVWYDLRVPVSQNPLQEKDKSCCLSVLMKIQETQTVIFLSKLIYFHCKTKILTRFGSKLCLLAVSETNFCIPLCPLKSRGLLFYFCLSSLQNFVNRLPKAFEAFSILQEYWSAYPSSPLYLPPWQWRQTSSTIIVSQESKNNCQGQKQCVLRILSSSLQTWWETQKMSSNRRLHVNIHDGKKKERKVEVGHCHLIWLHFYFSLYFGWSSGVLIKVYGARSSARIYKLYLHINMLDKFYS